jgi:branched-chain amino acid transport system ATP-binding protein
MLDLKGIVAGYRSEVPVLRGVSFRLRERTITSIIGANGAGKSTILRMVFGMLKPSDGTLHFGGEDVTGWEPKTALGRGVAYVGQGRCNFPQMSVRENLEVAAFTRRDAELRTDVEATLDRFEVLRRKASQLAGGLSGGQQQILEMAMALVNRPKLLLIDEPTLGLSPIMFDAVFETLGTIREDGVTVLMVEQNAKRALEISDHAVVMELGQKRMEGTGQEILHEPTVREHYLGGAL